MKKNSKYLKDEKPIGINNIKYMFNRFKYFLDTFNCFYSSVDRNTCFQEIGNSKIVGREMLS